MTRKEYAVELLTKKLNKKTFLSYIEIAELTGYHPKYLLKLKRELLNGTIKMVHGNTNKIPVNALSEEEKDYIVDLYQKSNVSIRKFCKFYNRRSYSCVYNVLKERGLI